MPRWGLRQPRRTSFGKASGARSVSCPPRDDRLPICYPVGVANRISGGLSARNPFGPSWGRASTHRAAQTGTVGQQIQQELFGQKKPRTLDVDDAALSAQLSRLHAYRKKLARLAGDAEDDYDLKLAADTIAMVDQDGIIYLGRDFLVQHEQNDAVLVGVLAHEVGHRPQRWRAFRETRQLSVEERNALCRTEETRADYFAGRALAELGLPCEPLATFLLRVQHTPHPRYFAAELRAEVIREGYQDAARRAQAQRALFPELARASALRLDLGEG